MAQNIRPRLSIEEKRTTYGKRWTSLCQYPELLGQTDVEYSRFVCNYSSPGYRIFILTTPGVVACDPGDLRRYTTGTLMACLCHTVVSLGDSVAQWARDNAGIPPQKLEGLLQLVGRRNARANLLREASVAAGGMSRRQQHLRDRDVHHAESPAQRPRGPPGHEGGAPLSGRR